MKKAALFCLDLMLTLWVASFFLPVPVSQKYRRRAFLLSDPVTLFAARTYNGSSDTGNFTVPNLSSYKKVALVYFAKYTSYGAVDFASASDAAFGTTAGAFASEPLLTFNETTCGVSNQWFVKMSTGDNSHTNGRWFADSAISLNVWHRIIEYYSIPGDGVGASNQFLVVVDGVSVALSGGSICPNFNTAQTTLQGAGSTASISDASQAFQIEDLAIFASTDNQAGLVAEASGPGLPSGFLGQGGGTLHSGDIQALGSTRPGGGSIRGFSAGSSCISARPIFFSPQLTRDTAGGQDPDWAGGRLGGAPHPVTLTGTTAGTSHPQIAPCWSDELRVP